MALNFNAIKRAPFVVLLSIMPAIRQNRVWGPTELINIVTNLGQLPHNIQTGVKISVAEIYLINLYVIFLSYDICPLIR
jgi:hypothetical protein